jgi:hypothetical protein
MISDVSENHSAFILRAKQYESVLGILDSADEGNTKRRYLSTSRRNIPEDLSIKVQIEIIRISAGNVVIWH